MQRVHVFECENQSLEGQLLPRRLRFRVYEDGAVTVEQVPVKSTLNNDVLDQAGRYCYVYDGRTQNPTAVSASWEKGEALEGDDVSFTCSFRANCFWRSTLQTSLLVCYGQLSPRNGFHGHYVVTNHDADQREAREMTLPVSINFTTLSHRVEALKHPMIPLSPGKYGFEGYTVAQNGHVYESHIDMELHEDGSLQGISKELIFPQQCQLQGKWTAKEIEYTLQYRIGSSYSLYSYTVAPYCGGLGGLWTHTDAVKRLNRSERGHVALQLVRADRIWSRAFHRVYPIVFHEVTKLLLVKALRASTGSPYAVPTALWDHVLSYCEFHHFQGESKKL
ncbi:hypothetical protein Poli38472_001188 [Pythium oligandrum]|uniref:Uncharacterized protein n=1 Tax=Pythium oligandrum TaxID=41045 RepID=A0A8K1FRI4_PYTOL|nr:hypothetical protein Poli38472_001188 [Pythium oligandrum]|eukprot:TMW69032.1 hypothetical protein Poli38472_001188 [Pythium oligandrum]